MTDAILVLNAGSSSIKFSLFAPRDGDVALVARGQIGGIVTAPAFRGLDAIVFTAGIGERDAIVRARVCRHAAWLGIELDEHANDGHGPRISTAGSRTAAWVIPTDEELVIARHTRDHLAGG